MAFSRIEHAGGAAVTTLNADITSGDTSLVLVSSTNWPTGGTGPFYLVIDPGLSGEEKILATTRSGTSLTGLTRGTDGTSAAAHTAGAVIKHIFTAVEADEANQAANKTLGAVTTKGDLLAATASQTLARLGVGANDLILTAASGQTTGLIWQTVATASITNSAVTAAKINTSAVDGSTITGGGGTALAVPTGGITATQLATNAVTTVKITDANVTNAKLSSTAVTLSKFASTARPVSICTAATHPGSPAVGDLAFETDTGNLLEYQSATTGWTPPWNTAWGELGIDSITSDVDLLGGGSPDPITGLSVTFTTVANRRVETYLQAASMEKHTTGRIKLWIDLDTATLRQLVFAGTVADGEHASASGALITGALAAGSHTAIVMVDAIGGTMKAEASTFGIGDPGPWVLQVRDTGPTAAPA